MKKLIVVLGMVLSFGVNLAFSGECMGNNNNLESDILKNVRPLFSLLVLGNRKHPAKRAEKKVEKRASGNTFSFPILGMKKQEGFDHINVLESSDDMNNMADEILLNCQGFIAEVAFYDRSDNSSNGAPLETYTLDHYVCYEVTAQIDEFLREGKEVCLTLDLDNYSMPIVENKKCEVQ